MYLILLFAALIIIGIIIIVLCAYSITVAYQQTLTITIPFDNTFRYVPNLNRDHKFKLDHVKITITGTIKKDAVLGSTIVPGARLKDIVRENIISPYKGCLLMHEANTFIVEENTLKRCPLVKNPTLENLSVLFFNKLAPILPTIGCSLVSISLMSEGTKVTHARYKMSNYHV